jgi:peptidase M23-like protein/tetratricopeptide repeat protein
MRRIILTSLVMALWLPALAPAQSESPAMHDALALYRAGKFAEAAKAYETVTRQEPDNGTAWYQWGQSLWEIGETARAVEVLQKADPLLSAMPMMQAGVRFRVGRAYARLKEREKAFEWLGRAMDSGFPNFQLFSTDPDVATLKGDPRYQKIYDQLYALTQPSVNPLLPVALEMPVRPNPFRSKGKTVLAYELHVCSLFAGDLTLQSLEVLSDTDKSERLARYEGKDLGDLMTHPGAATEPEDKASIAPGTRAVVFLWIPLDASTPTPARLRHKLLFRAVNPGNNVVQRILEGAVLDVGEPAITIGPPLRGEGWVARWIGNESFHRRGLMVVNGEMGIGQRFATDWDKYGPDWRSWHGEGKQNSDYASYGQEVVAVADAMVKSVKTGVPENGIQSANLPNTLDLAAGNNVVLDLGNGRYALYAHLKADIRVRPGQKVRRGEVLGHVGNTGNAVGPHLHFQIASKPAPLTGEGLPFVIDSYDLLGYETEEQGNSGAWPAPTGRAEMRKKEMPVANQVVRFGS